MLNNSVQNYIDADLPVKPTLGRLMQINGQFATRLVFTKKRGVKMPFVSKKCHLCHF